MSGASWWTSALLGSGRGFAQPALAAAGVVALALVPVGLAWAMLDHRLIHREGVALKPIKFALSIGVYLLTASWMLGYVRVERLTSWPVRAATLGLLAGAAVELFCIVLQAARGRRSHFNTATPLDAAISGTMGIMVILFVGMLLPLAWEIARRPRPGAAPLMIAAIVGGLVLTFALSALTGARMGRFMMDAVAPADLVLPVLGWRMSGGFIRIAHFLGVHAMQALPLMAFCALSLRGRVAVALFAAGTLGYCAAALALLLQAANAPTGVTARAISSSQRPLPATHRK